MRILSKSYSFDVSRKSLRWIRDAILELHESEERAAQERKDLAELAGRRRR
jgi:hypothetical protein